MNTPPVKPRSTSAWLELEAARRGKGVSGISSGEYDFSDVPDPERRAFNWYERARESRQIIGIVENVREYRRRRNRKPAPLMKFTRTHTRLYDHVFVGLLADLRGFPSVPWLDLSSADRKDLRGFPDFGFYIDERDALGERPIVISDTVQDDPRLLNMTLMEWVKERMPLGHWNTHEGEWVLGMYIASAQRSFSETQDAFAKLPLVWHPGANISPLKRRGRRSERDLSNALAAERLRYYCRTLSEAQEVAKRLRDKRDKFYYGGRTAWNRACKREFKRFPEVLDLKEVERPIHYTEGWQKYRG